MPRSRLPALVLLMAVAVSIMGLPNGGSAQTIPSPYRFIEPRHGAAGFVGFVAENRGELRLGPGGGPIFGGRYGFELTGPIAVEVSGFLLLTDREVHDPRGGVDAVVVLGTTDATVAGLDGRIRFNLTGPRTWRGLAPFLQAGGGIVQDLAGRSELESALGAGQRYRFGPSAVALLGAGTRWIPTDRVHFRLDTTFNVWKVTTPSGFLPTGPETTPVRQDEWTRTGTVLLGVTIPF